jgi:hypothetical protein
MYHIQMPQVTYKYIQGYFCDGTRWNAVLAVVSQKDASQNSVLEHFSPGTGITDTLPLQILGYYPFWNLFFLKKNSTEYSKRLTFKVK